MKIAIDLTSLDDNFSGLERYALCISKELIRNGKKDRFILVFKNRIHNDLIKETKSENVTPIIIKKKSKLLVNQWFLPQVMNRIPADVFLFPAFPVPFLFHKPNTYGLIADLTCYDCPETMKTKARVFFRVMTAHTIRICKKVITISNFSAKRICDKFHRNASCIIMAPCGINQTSFQADVSREENVREKYHLPKHYYLSLSTIEPRKNIDVLLHAYANALKKNKELMPLAFAGRSGWLMQEKIESVSEELKKHVLFTGFIEEEDIALVYSMADCFIFPSKYEGFGMPPLEAQAAGVERILSSDADALQEVLGQTATYFPKNDAKKLQMFIENDAAIKKTTDCERKANLERYSWNDSARQIRTEMEGDLDGAKVAHSSKKKLKDCVRDVIPRSWINLRNRIRDGRALKHAAVMMRAEAKKWVNDGSKEFGICFYGDRKAQTGLGQSVRLVGKLLEMTQIPFCYQKEEPQKDYAINLFHIQPDKWPSLMKSIDKDRLSGHKNIAYWLWEAPDFPTEWKPALECFDEFWVPSEFIAKALRKETKRPVLVLPYAMEIEPITETNRIRKEYNIPLDACVYLIMYDSLSGSARKNPEDAIRAFIMAFPKENENVWLMIKGKHLTNKEKARLHRLLANYKYLIWVEDTLTEQKVREILAMSDVLISLHHAEGFGLPMAEAMYLNTAVVATGWSGNMEFMNENNSCVVPFERMTLAHDEGPYRKGTRWVQPNVEFAAQQIQKLESDKEFLKQIKENARKDIAHTLSYEKIGSKLKNHMEVLQQEWMGENGKS